MYSFFCVPNCSNFLHDMGDQKDNIYKLSEHKLRLQGLTN